jgi:hypothetical protein
MLLSQEKKPVFSWIPIVFHYIVALSISWFGIPLIESSGNFEGVIKPLLLKGATLINSIEGYAAISSYPNQVRFFLLSCWLGVPVYSSFFWRLSAHVLTQWAKTQRTLRFWLIMLGNLIGAIAIWWLPSEAYAIRTVSMEYSRASNILLLSKDNFIFLSILGFTSVYAFSFLVGVCAQAIRIRLFK